MRLEEGSGGIERLDFFIATVSMVHGRFFNFSLNSK